MAEKTSDCYSSRDRPERLPVAISLGAAPPSSLQLLHRLQYPLDVAHLRNPQVPQVTASQRQELSPCDVMLRKRLRVLAELKRVQPSLDFLDPPGPHLGDAVPCWTLGHAAPTPQPAPGDPFLLDLRVW
jgi:hypothetical protein